jgi:ABC-type multidrug transport system fused ATPase/permease subunit
VADSFTPPRPADLRGPLRYLWWLVRSQPWRVVAGALISSVWMVLLALSPYLMSRAIDDGLQTRQAGVLVAWVAALFVVGSANGVIGLLRHRTMTKVRMDASFRTVRAVARQSVRLGATLPRRLTAGEVVTIGMSDVQTIAEALTVMGPGIGSVVAYLAVAAVMLSISPVLAAVVLAGVPALGLAVGPLLGRMQQVGGGYRTEQGSLTARLVDIVTGLRILNGLGGKDEYAQRFRRDSAALRARGYHVGAVTSWVDAFGIGLPALFLAVVTWLGARMAAAGTISIGELVAVYGYVAVLVIPVAFFIEGSGDITRATIAADRVIRFLALRPEQVDADPVADPPAGPAALVDPTSGVRVEPGRLTALAANRPADAAAVVDRLGRFVATDATWGGIRLDRVALAAVRDRILVADNEAELFAGSLREVIAGRTAGQEDAAILAAVDIAAARDVLDGLPDGLDSTVAAQGRNLSGGQRQRLRLAQAVHADPEILLAVEPTSAVDAHTEAAMATRLRAARTGRTTVVTTTSPLVLDRADVVIHLVDGRVAATGPHQELLRDSPGYRELVSREDALR